MGVEYRTLERFPRYRFGSDGSVWAWKKKKREWKRLQGSTNRYGYLVLDRRSLKGRIHQISNLICEAFHGPRPDHHTVWQVAHWNGNTKDNSPSNLRWATVKENVEDNRRLGRLPMGSRHCRAKITEGDVRRIRSSQEPGRELADRYGISPQTVCDIQKRRTWKQVI